MTILTPELASKMLRVYARRLRDARDTKYISTLYEAAMGAPDFPPELPNFIRRQKARSDGLTAYQRRKRDVFRARMSWYTR